MTHLRAPSACAAGALVLAALLLPAGADLPVHCLLQDVAGEWDFQVGPPQKPAFSDQVAAIPACGHHLPNTVLSMLAADPSKEIPEATKERFRVKLTEDIAKSPMRHLAVVGGANSSGAAAGKMGAGGYWTMVFDEGFEVRSLGGRSFFAHFHFESVPNASRAPRHGDRWDDIAKYYGRVSDRSYQEPEGDIYACHCDRLSVGWWHERGDDGKLQSGCFWAKKVPKEAEGSGAAAGDASAVSLVRWRKAEGKPPSPAASLRGAGGHRAAPVAAHSVASLAEKASRGAAADLGKVLELSDLPVDPYRKTQKEVLMPPARELQSEVEQTSALAKQAPALAGARGLPGAVRLANVGKGLGASNGSSLPKFWDWRDELEDLAPEGVDDLSEQFNQGNCGSCYAFSGAQVLQMRYRIQLFKKHGILYPLELSWKSATRCSPDTEGCEGGFAYLIFKYAAEVGLPLAECDRATQPKDLDQTCNWACYRNNSMIFYAKDYGQTGGFAHGASEDSIMREIHANGPVIVSFHASAIPEFIYNNGKSLRKETDVLTVIKNDKVPREPSSANSKILPWSYTTHSILAVGWGEETGPSGELLKYWVVRNSWGKDWGRQGYAKIRRGNNDAAIETSAPWVEPDMDRLPPGFLEMAKKYHAEQELVRAKAGASPSQKAPVVKENHGGRPAYCKLRPDSPDCK